MDEIKVGKTVIKLQQGDILRVGTEAIVNAANSDLAAGGGVCGAIYRAAGYDELDRETAKYNGCPTGSAVITSAGKIPLPTRHVIHAVGPIYSDYPKEENERLLASAYRTSLELAAQNHLKSLAFPAISTGIYGYDINEATPVVLQTLVDYLKNNPTTSLELILLVLFSSADFEVYRQNLAKVNL
jgi:O-acetyl-ADP-ribose deacetylase